MINVELWAEVRRRHRVEGLSIRAISRQLRLSRNTVRSALRSSEPPRYRRAAKRPSKLDPYKGRIGELLEGFPGLSGVRVHEILTDEGFSGSARLVRRYLQEVRPRPIEAYQRTQYRPGQIGQVDWGRMPVAIPDPMGELRHPWVFLMTLGYSRMLTLGFSFRTRMVDFLRCHVQALEFFGGVPHILVYDNLKSVVVKRRGKDIVFNAEFLTFADHYGFQPLPHWPGEPHEKGLVERPVDYVKGNFAAGRRFDGLEDLTSQGAGWRDRTANVRDHGTLHEQPIKRFEKDRAHLLPLPRDPFQVEETLFAKATRWGYVQVDANEYSVPLLLAGRRLKVRLSPTQVQIFHDGKLVAEHARCLARHQVFTVPEHQEKPWRVCREPWSPPEPLAPGLELPGRVQVRVQERDLSVYDALLPEVEP
jgi:transposase